MLISSKYKHLSLISVFILTAIILLSSSKIASSQSLVNLSAGAQLHIRSNAVIQINGSVKLADASTFSCSDTCNIFIRGNWTNEGAVFNSASSAFIFEGNSIQYIKKTVADKEVFNTIILNNPTELDVDTLGTSLANGLEIKNLLVLKSGIVTARQRYVQINNTIARPGSSPGHINGNLRKIAGIDAAILNFEIGYKQRYTPLSLSFQGTGGISGFINAISDTITNLSSPVSTGLSPTGSGLSDINNLRRQWTVSIPTGSSFAIGAGRTYTAIMNFIPGTSPLGDIPSGTRYELLEPRLWTGSAWILPKGIGSPLTGTRTASSTGFELLNAFGTFAIGQPSVLTFYSRANDNWTNANSWSTQKYGGEISPITPTSEAAVYIGNSNTITLDANFSTSGLVICDSSGYLDFTDKIISGLGEFRLIKRSSVATSNSAGFAATGAFGSVQTSVRNYNYNNHFRGNFIFKGTLAQSTGSGVPDTVAILRIHKATGANASLTKAVSIIDSLHIKCGDFTAAFNINILGNFRKGGPTSRFIPASNLVVFNGSTEQYIANDSTNEKIPFYNLTVNKPVNSGNLTLRQSSPVSITRILSLPSTNYGLINANLSTDNYVEVNDSIYRRNGHIYGWLRRYVQSGNASVLFPVGSDTLIGYRPLTFKPSAPTNTAGFLGVRFTPSKYPDLTTSGIDTSISYLKYWTLISYPSTYGYALGAGNTYTVTTQFLNPLDLKNDPPLTLLKHHLRNPEYPAMPRTWYHYSNSISTDTTLTTSGLTLFGDILVGFQGDIYYSVKSGAWNDLTSWSLGGYGTNNTPVELPNGDDIVRISDNKKIVVPSTLVPDIKTLYVEKFNATTGALHLDGETYITGLEFILENDCELGTQNTQGISNVTNTGCIQTTTRNFGVSRYNFYSAFNNPKGGNGIPDSVAALIVNATAGGNSKFSFPIQSTGNNPIKIRDSLSLMSGTATTNGRTFYLYGDFHTYNYGTVPEGRFEAQNCQFYIAGPKVKSFIIGNNSGIEFNDVDVSGGDIFVTSRLSAGPKAYFLSNGKMVLKGTVIHTRANDRSVKIARTGSFSRPNNAGYIDGTFIKFVDKNATINKPILFEIGEGVNYTPANIAFTSSSTDIGYIKATNYAPVPNTIINGQWSGNRLDRTNLLNRYWRLEPDSLFDMGGRTADITFQFPKSNLTFDTTLAVGRRLSIPAETPLWDQKTFPQLDWWTISDSAYVSTALNNNWKGLGEFYFGIKAPRFFYSRENGLWASNNSWTYLPSHIGPSIGAYPNDDPSEVSDVVEIGLKHNIVLDKDSVKIKSISIIDTSRLDMQQFSMLNPLANGNFNLDESGTLAFGGAKNPQVTISGFQSYTLGLFTTVEYYGNNQYITPSPFGLNYGSVLVNLTGIKFASLPSLIRRNLIIRDTAEFRVMPTTIQVWGSVYNNAFLNNYGRIEIGN